MTEARTIQSLKAAKECINAAIKNVKNKNDISAEVAIDNAIECLRWTKKAK